MPQHSEDYRGHEIDVATLAAGEGVFGWTYVIDGSVEKASLEDGAADELLALEEGLETARRYIDEWEAGQRPAQL